MFLILKHKDKRFLIMKIQNKTMETLWIIFLNNKVETFDLLG